jgi:hypothetical protein
VRLTGLRSLQNGSVWPLHCCSKWIQLTPYSGLSSCVLHRAEIESLAGASVLHQEDLGVRVVLRVLVPLLFLPHPQNLSVLVVLLGQVIQVDHHYPFVPGVLVVPVITVAKFSPPEFRRNGFSSKHVRDFAVDNEILIRFHLAELNNSIYLFAKYL